jgi:GNAT superfamily N-acetyltransferase
MAIPAVMPDTDVATSHCHIFMLRSFGLGMQGIEIREFIITDQSFIIDSWKKSFYATSEWASRIPKREFEHRHSALICNLIKESTVLIAAQREEPDIIVGYVVFQRDVLHYIYVKEAFRGFGIASKLIAEANFPWRVRYTHLTDRGRKICEKLGFIYSPYFDT